VFRYALENWRPDAYQVFVLSRGPLTEQQQQWVERMRSAATEARRPANLQVHAIDLQQAPLQQALQQRVADRPDIAQALPLLEQSSSQQSLDAPQMLVFYPHVWDRLAWQAELSAERVEQLIDSPLRQQVATRLLDGQSVVWVLLDSGHAERDEQAWQVLQAELTRSAQVVELPARELIESDEFFRPEVPIELRVEFSAVRIAKDDAAEQAFASMLRSSEADLRDFDEPIAVPIYGRGRTYFALVGAGINAQMVEENGRFLCGACSCQVKEENPGLDMLMAVDWAHRVQGTAMPDVVLPELTGIGALDLAAKVADSSAAEPQSGGARFAQVAAAPAEGTAEVEQTSEHGIGAAGDSAASETEQSVDHSAASPAVPPQPVADNFQRWLLLSVAGGAMVAVILLGLATFWLRRTL
jgi:hypothetical protein